jgi:hypothetical protein
MLSSHAFTDDYFPEKYGIIEGCKFCGKSKREIEEAIKEGNSTNSSIECHPL